MGRIGSPKTSGTNYLYTLRSISEKRISLIVWFGLQVDESVIGCDVKDLEVNVHWLDVMEKATRNVKIAHIAAEIRTQHFHNTSLKHYRYTSALRSFHR
jgi:hypothetical protein